MMSKKVTLKDVARRAGVSYQTVSKVLRKQKHVTPEVYCRIHEAVEALGYRPNVIARNLRMQSSRLIGYSWEPWRLNFFNPVLEQFQQSIVDAAEELGYHILLFPQRSHQPRAEIYRELVISGRVDGFILSGVEYNDPRIPTLQKLNVPSVAFGRTDSDAVFPYVEVDGEAGMRMAVEHLQDQGHQRIAILAWPEDSRVGQERLAGYTAAMRAARLPIDPAWLARGTGEYEFGYAATPALLNLPPQRRPTAIVTLYDLVAIGAMRAIAEHGLRIGRDVAVVGFDDMPVLDYFKPGLTTIRQPILEVGKRVVRLLVNLLEGTPVENRQIVLNPELIVRDSSLGFAPGR